MKKIRELFQNTKLNIKFTSMIILFMVIPIGIFAGVLFYVMKQNAVQENMDYMEYTIQRNEDGIQTKIDSINMSTRFFLRDDSLLRMLNASAVGEEISTAEWLDFKNNEVLALERLVNNNPLLYGVRVYAVNDSVQEMMPILYNASRMKKQEWAGKEKYVGWNFDYTDNIFNSYTMNQNRKIISLVTPIIDSDNGKIGVIESAMTMENMFPSLYEGIEGEWNFFYSDAGVSYFGEEGQMESSALLDDILKEYQEEDESARMELRRAEEYFVQKRVFLQNHDIMTGSVTLGDAYEEVTESAVRELSGTLICVKDITKNVHNVYFMRDVFVAVMFAFIILLAFFINRIVQHMLKQFYEILKSIRKVQKGDLDVVIENCGKDEMGELGTQINKMLERIKELMEDNVNREMLAKNSEIRALQNQINAHFIYNVLESIKMMAEMDEEYAISDAVTALGKLLRYSMKWVSGNVLVEQELEYIKNYMALINLRFDYEIYLSLNLPEQVLKQEIPKMSLQPIVENAIYHGIEQMAEDTNIYIKGILDGDDCVIEITDAGKGMSEEEVERLRLKIAGKIDSNGGSGNGIGLKNVQDRIHIAFGEQYGIEIASKLGCYTKIMVRIPIMHRTSAENELEVQVEKKDAEDCARRKIQD